MLFKSILVPYDKSDSAYQALLKAREIAETDKNIELHVVNVAPIAYSQLLTNTPVNSLGADPIMVKPEDFKALSDNAMQKESDIVNEHVGLALDGFINPLTVTVIAGSSPVDEIVIYAEEHDCDLIVMGCRGLGALRGVLGSVSYGVIRSAKVPVLIIK